MIAEIQRLTDEYHVWLREKTILRSVDDWVEITTPYLDRHNDLHPDLREALKWWLHPD